MRVVAGSARGRRLAAPAGNATRPTSDRVRESIFNALGSLGAVEGATVIDLYAGSGAMGVEALSRGAARATFVEADRAALACIRQNLDATGLAEVADVVAGDVRSFLQRSDARFDLALVDPPYSFDAWHDLLVELPAEMAVLESDRGVEPPAGWRLVRQKRYGSTVVTIISRTTRRSGEQSE